MDMWQERGLAIAESNTVQKNKLGWRVPSQSGNGTYEVIKGLLEERSFEFPVERAIYYTVLHRLFESGSDRASPGWRRDIRIPSAEPLELHHLYRTIIRYCMSLAR